MDITPLAVLVFLLAFGGMVVIHEFGHFIVARLCKIEVEEFGIGLPTPGALTYWIARGYLLLKGGKWVEIPQNFRLHANWSSLVDHEARITVDQFGNRWVMRSIEAVLVEHQQGSEASQKIIRAGDRKGATELVDIIAEVHPGTRFTLNWLLLGGFVRPKGENDPNVPGGLAAANPWKRLAVLFAGPVMNLLSAVIIFSVIYIRIGVPETDRVLVSSITPGNPAAEAGFQAGDIFVSGNGQTITSYEELRLIVDANESRPVTFVVEREGRQIELVATPRMNQEAKRIMIGVGLATPFKPASSWLETIPLGLRATWENTKALITLPFQMIKGNLSPEEGRIIGPIGIYRIFEQTVAQDIRSSQAGSSASADPFDKPIRTLNLIASISISLGVFNILPFPALDGGRIIFVLPELIFRRRVPHERENFVHGVAMVLLLGFMAYVIVMDIINPVTLPVP